MKRVADTPVLDGPARRAYFGVDSSTHEPSADIEAHGTPPVSLPGF
jgi:hypothetical protein